MKAKSILALLLLMLPVLSLFTNAKETPYPKREFRGAWIQCVNGQYLGKSMEEIRKMLSSQLDVLEGAGINAILFQVRAEGDALYASRFEPWSRYLTGVQGVGPQDGWDPLAWMVDECHKRNMECHAWINPYRAKTKGTTELAPNHIAKRHPDQVFQYGDLLIMNPALEANRMFTCMVVEDILERYDVDGIHMDDYFYPYPVAGEAIPDAEFFKADPRGFKNIGDWRRDNVNQLIKELYQLIREVKPWVKFGISPFGIYRNNPEKKNAERGSATNGTQNYDDLYADIVLWQKKGWIDYTIPQIYWNFGTKAADYEVLCHWWNDYCGNRSVFIGQDVERTVKEADPKDPSRHQQYAKYDLQRSLKNIQGSCQWYAAACVNNPGNYRTVLETHYHKYPALQPRMPFIDKKAPKKPSNPKVMETSAGKILMWTPPVAKKDMDKAMKYVIYAFDKKEKVNLDDPSKILSIVSHPSYRIDQDLKGKTIVITSLDRLQNESKGKKIKFK